MKKEQKENNCNQLPESSYSQDSDYCDPKIINLIYKEQHIRAIEAGEDYEYINSENINSVDALCSHGFASCIAIIVKSTNNECITLSHNPFCQDDYKFIRDHIDCAKDFIISKKTNSPPTVQIGFSWKKFNKDQERELSRGDEYLTKTDYDKDITDKITFLQTLQDEYKTGPIIDLPQATILINRKGEIETSMPQRLITEALKETKQNTTEDQIDQENTKPSPTSPTASAFTLGKRQRSP
jgi:hypothetical protein